MSLTYGSVCSGIEAATVAWAPFGWRCAFASEIEAFPRAVLQYRHPEIPLHGDFTTIEADRYAPIDLLVGGTPCQSFSVAGLRGGLDDDRGNLALEYLRLADRLRPRWLVWENVPGVLSSNKGRDFGAILGGMGELGYGFAYRVLDAQFFGVAQRRRRVFVVGHLGDWRRAAAVLFERHSLSGHPAPSREKGERPAPTISARPSGGGGLGTDFDCDGGLIAFGSKEYAQDAGDVSPPLRAMGSSKEHPNGGGQVAIAYSIMPQNSGKDYKARPVEVAQPVMAGGPVGGNQGGDYVLTLAIRGRGDGHNLEWRDDGTANAILTPNGGRAGMGVGAVAFDLAQITSAANRTRVGPELPASTLNAKGDMHVAFNTRQDPIYGDHAQRQGAKDNGHGLLTGSAVRRLTPRECERLQGFPDDYTLIPWRKGLAPDGPRYKALGNSMAVPVMAWIGARIALVEAIPKADAA